MVFQVCVCQAKIISLKNIEFYLYIFRIAFIVFTSSWDYGEINEAFHIQEDSWKVFVFLFFFMRILFCVL